MNECDVAIIGAGIAGLGAADALCRRGYRVVVFEQGSIAQGSSDNSLRIIHGGLRYLQKGDFLRVFESIAAQRRLLKEFEELIRPLHCVLALDGKGTRRPFVMRIAALLYQGCNQLVALKTAGPPPLPRAAVRPLESSFAGARMSASAFEWWDAQLLSPRALSAALTERIFSAGGEIRTSTRVEALDEHAQGFSVIAKDQPPLMTRWVVDLAGRLAGELHPARPFGRVQWSRAFNVVLQHRAPCGEAMAFPGSTSGAFFLVGRGELTALGTGYLPVDTEVDDRQVSKFLDQARQSEPGLRALQSAVQGVEVGYIPVRGWRGETPVFYGLDQLVVIRRYIAGLVTKYTTFQSLAERIARIIS